MAITLDQTNVGSAANSASSTTLALVTSNIVAVGATIFISGIANAATVSSVSGGSISWVVDTTSATTNAFASLIRGYAAAGLASGSTITLTYNVADTGKLAVASSFTGIDSVSPLGTVGAGTSNPSAQNWASTSMSPAAGDIAVAATSYFSSGGVTDGGTNAPASGTTELNNARNSGTDDEVVLSYRTTAGTVAGAFTTAASTWNCAVATYKAASAATATRTFNPVPFMSNGRL